MTGVTGWIFGNACRDGPVRRIHDLLDVLQQDRIGTGFVRVGTVIK